MPFKKWAKQKREKREFVWPIEKENGSRKWRRLYRLDFHIDPKNYFSSNNRRKKRNKSKGISFFSCCWRGAKKAFMPRGAIFIFNGLSTQGTTSSSLDYRWIGGRCRFALEAPRVYSKKIIIVFLFYSCCNLSFDNNLFFRFLVDPAKGGQSGPDSRRDIRRSRPEFQQATKCGQQTPKGAQQLHPLCQRWNSSSSFLPFFQNR